MGMKAVLNERSETWHLVGNRGCGAEPDGLRIEGSWAEIRDEVERSAGTPCSHCRWPTR